MSHSKLTAPSTEAKAPHGQPRTRQSSSQRQRQSQDAPRQDALLPWSEFIRQCAKPKISTDIRTEPVPRHQDLVHYTPMELFKVLRDFITCHAYTHLHRTRSHVLDICCGSGRLSRPLCHLLRPQSVALLDINDELLSYCYNTKETYVNVKDVHALSVDVRTEQKIPIGATAILCQPPWVASQPELLVKTLQYTFSVIDANPTAFALICVPTSEAHQVRDHCRIRSLRFAEKQLAMKSGRIKDGVSTHALVSWFIVNSSPPFALRTGNASRALQQPAPLRPIPAPVAPRNDDSEMHSQLSVQMRNTASDFDYTVKSSDSDDPSYRPGYDRRRRGPPPQRAHLPQSTDPSNEEVMDNTIETYERIRDLEPSRRTRQEKEWWFQFQNGGMPQLLQLVLHGQVQERPAILLNHSSSSSDSLSPVLNYQSDDDSNQTPPSRDKLVIVESEEANGAVQEVSQPLISSQGPSTGIDMMNRASSLLQFDAGLYSHFELPSTWVHMPIQPETHKPLTQDAASQTAPSSQQFYLRMSRQQLEQASSLLVDIKDTSLQLVLTQLVQQMDNGIIRTDLFLQAFMRILKALSFTRGSEDLTETAANGRNLLGIDPLVGLQKLLSGLCATHSESTWATSQFQRLRSEIEHQSSLVQQTQMRLQEESQRLLIANQTIQSLQAETQHLSIQVTQLQQQTSFRQDSQSSQEITQRAIANVSLECRRISQQHQVLCAQTRSTFELMITQLRSNSFVSSASTSLDAVLQSLPHWDPSTSRVANLDPTFQPNLPEWITQAPTDLAWFSNMAQYCKDCAKDLHQFKEQTTLLIQETQQFTARSQQVVKDRPAQESVVASTIELMTVVKRTLQTIITTCNTQRTQIQQWCTTLTSTLQVFTNSQRQEAQTSIEGTTIVQTGITLYSVSQFNYTLQLELNRTVSTWRAAVSSMTEQVASVSLQTTQSIARSRQDDEMMTYNQPQHSSRQPRPQVMIPTVNQELVAELFAQQRCYAEELRVKQSIKAHSARKEMAQRPHNIPKSVPIGNVASIAREDYVPPENINPQPQDIVFRKTGPTPRKQPEHELPSAINQPAMHIGNELADPTDLSSYDQKLKRWSQILSERGSKPFDENSISLADIWSESDQPGPNGQHNALDYRYFVMETNMQKVFTRCVRLICERLQSQKGRGSVQPRQVAAFLLHIIQPRYVIKRKPLDFDALTSIELERIEWHKATNRKRAWKLSYYHLRSRLMQVDKQHRDYDTSEEEHECNDSLDKRLVRLPIQTLQRVFDPITELIRRRVPHGISEAYQGLTILTAICAGLAEALHYRNPAAIMISLLIVPDILQTLIQRAQFEDGLNIQRFQSLVCHNPKLTCEYIEKLVSYRGPAWSHAMYRYFYPRLEELIQSLTDSNELYMIRRSFTERVWEHAGSLLIQFGQFEPNRFFNALTFKFTREELLVILLAHAYSWRKMEVTKSGMVPGEELCFAQLLTRTAIFGVGNKQPKGWEEIANVYLRMGTRLLIHTFRKDPNCPPEYGAQHRLFKILSPESEPSVIIVGKDKGQSVDFDAVEACSEAATTLDVTTHSTVFKWIAFDDLNHEAYYRRGGQVSKIVKFLDQLILSDDAQKCLETTDFKSDQPPNELQQRPPFIQDRGRPMHRE